MNAGALPAAPVLVAALAGAAVLVWPHRRGPAWTPVVTPWGRGGGRSTLAPLSPNRPSRPAAGSVRGLVPEALELVALALLGGGSLARAVTSVGLVLPGPCGRELVEVGARLRDGAAEGEVWDGAGEHWAPARRSLALAEASGVAPGQALVRSAEDLRRDAVADVEVAAARLGVRLVLPLGLAYLPAFVLTTVLPVVLALTRDLAW
ncbi:type II secretion system F family protein [Ornithinimicrobium pekingense]|uniref:Type II secretion system protein GspF domain-containing protein n=1 Tax=Ornithinimicrobium pekingense TaxID=384677 RepID=A0ABQ2F3A3_9MICO|nr:type II secretion system F family protein [Ornithinimicrobium pekingense]GGK57810.1 hypothetical protein GCM10011509_02790 [Ornithinimicrobium pekingense]